MPRPPARPAPRIQLGAAEVKLAAWSLLLGGNRPFGGQLPKGVPMNTQVVRGVPRVEPLVVCTGVRGGGRIGRGRKTFNHTLSELVDQSVEERVPRRGVAALRRAIQLLWCRSAWLAGLSRRVAYAAIVVTSLVGLGQAPGCCCTAGAALCLQLEATRPFGRIRFHL